EEWRERGRFSSLTSSTTRTHWLLGTARRNAPRAVVLPAPVGPANSADPRTWARHHRNDAAAGDQTPRRTRLPRLSSAAVYMRIVDDNRFDTGSITAVSRARPPSTWACW